MSFIQGPDVFYTGGGGGRACPLHRLNGVLEAVLLLYIHLLVALKCFAGHSLGFG